MGLVCAVAASQAIASSLYGLSPFDPLAYGAVLGVLAVAAAAALFVPARRTARIDPIKVLRRE